MINFKTNILTLIIASLMTIGVCAQAHSVTAGLQSEKSHANCSMMKTDKSNSQAQGHANHHDEVNARGEKAMGFSQTATTHHFLLSQDGGAIQVEVNDSSDTANREKIREHLKHITGMFRAGNFRIPMLVHDQVPPGVTAMEDLREQIRFTYEETTQGGRVRISTKDKAALAAVHQFLRFQIEDHQTGDSLKVDTIR